MTNLAPFLVYVFVVTFTPGPNNILSMVNGMRYGYQKMIKFLAGIVAGFFIVMFISGLLNVALSSLIPDSELWIKILGAVYMLYLAYHIIRSGPVDETEGNSSINSFKLGFAMQFLNIKAILFGISVYSLFIINLYKSPFMIFLFAIFLAITAYVATSAWALGGNIFRSVGKKHYRMVNFIMAGLLIYTAIAGLMG
ncbi:MAG: LysE family transporter [Chloroflexota bacterium]